MKRLSTHRTAALKAEVAWHPHVALVALKHRLARRLMCDDNEGASIARSYSKEPCSAADGKPATEQTGSVSSLGRHAVNVERRCL